ncbi:uncharacterized protein BDV17DRAFT_293596 [Aspergillus undulatus]|uniref:uncharacterized protein n=1 Tax=Aspergillus undulatus TaxID=1810928 RepID=UPI003CCDA54D
MATEVIDIDGHAIIDCSGVTFRVSTHALALGYPVLQSMLRPQFKEGLTIKRASAEPDIPAITLPAHEPGAFRLFCNIVYLKLDLIPETLEPKALKILATFIDKYNCQVASADHGKM